MTCLMLAMQSTFCTAAVLFGKSIHVLNLAPFDTEAARKWFPISFMLASVIYTGSKSLVRLHNSIMPAYDYSLTVCYYSNTLVYPSSQYSRILQ